MKTLQEIYDKIEGIRGYEGDALTGDILSGKKAWVGGVQVIGTMANVGQQNVTPGTVAQTITQGYHNGTGVVAGAADLVAANIKKDVTIFGVTGTLNIDTGVPTTGQTITYRTGDDGAHQRGVAWPDPRFTDHGDGTVTDNMTGLIWLKNASVWNGTRAWDSALSNVVELNTSGTMNGNAAGDTSNGGSHQTDWRLPNVNELLSLIDHGNPGDRSLPAGHPFTGVIGGDWAYWSSTTPAGVTGAAGIVYVGTGQLNIGMKAGGMHVWPVRGGQ